MKKVIQFGKIDYNGNGRKNCLVELSIKLEVKGDKEIFSVCGNVWNYQKSDIHMGGQCLDSIWKDFSKQIENKHLFHEIMMFWKKWHLNDMNAGTEEQEKALKDYFGLVPEYSKAVQYLDFIGLNTDYKYGSAWIYRAIDKKDLERIKEIINQ